MAQMTRILKRCMLDIEDLTTESTSPRRQEVLAQELMRADTCTPDNASEQGQRLEVNDNRTAENYSA